MPNPTNPTPGPLIGSLTFGPTRATGVPEPIDLTGLAPVSISSLQSAYTSQRSALLDLCDGLEDTLALLHEQTAALRKAAEALGQTHP